MAFGVQIRILSSMLANAFVDHCQYNRQKATKLIFLKWMTFRSVFFFFVRPFFLLLPLSCQSESVLFSLTLLHSDLSVLCANLTFHCSIIIVQSDEACKIPGHLTILSVISIYFIIKIMSSEHLITILFFWYCSCWSKVSKDGGANENGMCCTRNSKNEIEEKEENCKQTTAWTIK